jgi:hypothetical protein
MAEHTILVAFTVEAEDRFEAHAFLPYEMPKPKGADFARPTQQITSWWVAEDQRQDGSDNDSAVFVNPGRQAHAAAVLAELGMTGVWNISGDATMDGRRWDVAAEINADNWTHVPPAPVYGEVLRVALNAASAWVAGDAGTENEVEKVRAALALLNGDVAECLSIEWED